MTEKCANPFRYRSRTHDSIAVYIMLRNKIFPVCNACWLRIAKSPQEW